MSYQNIKDKLYHGQCKIANNTYMVLARDVPAHTECIVMTLHSNVVARFYPDYLKLYSAGWHTVTTKSRLNLALELAGIRGRVYQKDWQWYYTPLGCTSIKFEEGIKIAYDKSTSTLPMEVIKC